MLRVRAIQTDQGAGFGLHGPPRAAWAATPGLGLSLLMSQTEYHSQWYLVPSGPFVENET